jgi:glucose-6-phosphate 1-epimerase
MDIAQLNADHGLTDQLKFVEGKGGFPFIEVNNSKAKAVISLYSGQVLSFQPQSEEELMFVSEKAYYQSGKAIKGGVPICWPWFGPDPDNAGRAAHGFVRNRMWEVIQSQSIDDGATQLILGLSNTPETQSIWPQSFKLTLTITIGESLTLELATHNVGDAPFDITQAFHTYFKVGDISQVEVVGLNGVSYLDKAASGQKLTQSGAVTVNQEVDRVYQDVLSQEIEIVDISLNRRIVITSQGSKTAIVWNPWSEISAKMADLDDDDYLHFICVETANAVSDVITVDPGAEVKLVANYRIERGL